MTNETKAQNALTEAGDLIEFTALSFDTYTDCPYELHRAGCADIKKKRAIKWNIEAASIDDAVDEIIDDELREMGYDDSHVHVLPCCRNHS